ncbi:MAG TPA: hypothetical protein VF487_11805 [Chitinophagaceae bacterium]
MFSYTFYDKNRTTAIRLTIFIFILLAIYAILLLPFQKRRLEKFGKYTIGVVINIVDKKDAYDPLYQYIVNGVAYTSTEARLIQGTYNFNQTNIGKRYFVLYDSTNPVKSCLLPLYLVPDSVGEGEWENIDMYIR